MNGFLSASHLTVRHELQKPNYSVRVCVALAAVLTPRRRVNTLICFNTFHIQFSPKCKSAQPVTSVNVWSRQYG